MPMGNISGFEVVLAVTGVVVLGFVVGTIRNRRLLEEYLSRLRGPLLTYGEKASARRLGTSGYHIIVPKAKPPFRKIDAMIYVQPREFIFYWGLNWLRRRGDRLYLHVTLMRPPLQQVIAGRRVSVPPAPQPPNSWGRESLALWGKPVYARGSLAPEMAHFLSQLADAFPQVDMLHLRRKAPHITCEIPLSSLPDVHAMDRLFALMRKVPLQQRA